MHIVKTASNIISMNSKVVLLTSDFSKIEDTLVFLDNHKDFKVFSADSRCKRLENAEMITLEQEKNLLDLYYLYEFSDKFIVLDDSVQYGSLFNYVNNGLISIEQALDLVFD